MFKGFFLNDFWLALKIVIVNMLFVLIRATLPRYRFDQLMGIGWKVFLPVIFGLLLFYTGFLLITGCLPFILQLPFLFQKHIFYFTLNRSVI